MLTYIYFVKCPGCEDEHFDFFNDAKEYAMGLLSQKPIITQTEVDRNDFGECTDSCDLGTVWSWEEMMNDIPSENTQSTFSKSDTFNCDADFFNQEFADLDDELEAMTEDLITEDDSRVDPEYERKHAQAQRGYDASKAPSSSATSARDNDLENRASRTQLGNDANRAPTKSETSARDNDLENRASRTQLGYNPHQAPSKAETSARDNDLENRDAVAPDQKTISKILVKYATLMPYDMFDKLESKAAQVLKASKPWWLKSPGDEAGYACCVTTEGGIKDQSVASKQGLRPVIEVIPADFADDKLYQPVKALNGDWIKISDKYLLFKTPTEMVAFDNINTLQNDFDKAAIKKTLDAWCEKYFKSVGAVFGSNSAEYTKEVSKELSKKESARPIPVGMTIEQLVEEMEENEDEVECTWCNELFGKDQCRKEVDLGWLCDRCQAAIKSRGEPLTFRENDYWDFLDESFNSKDKVELEYDNLRVTLQGPKRAEDDWDEAEETVQYTYAVDAPSVIEVLWEDCLTEEDVASVPGGLDALYEDDKAFNDFMKANFDDLVEKYMDKLLKHFEDDAIEEYERTHSLGESVKAPADPRDLVELEYPSLTVTLYGTKRAADDWDEEEYTDSHVFLVPKVEVATAIWENWITEDDVKDVEGGLEALDDDIAWEKFLETHFDDLFEKYNKQILEYFKDEATEDFRERSQEEYQMNNLAAAQDRAYDEWRDEKYFGESKQKPFLEEFDDVETRKANLIDCPECGSASYDMKEQYCSNCGLGL